MHSSHQDEQKEQGVEALSKKMYGDLLTELYAKRDFFIAKALDPEKTNDESYKKEKNEKAFLINKIERQLRDKYAGKEVDPEALKEDLQAIVKDKSNKPLIASSGFLGAVRTSEMESLFNKYIKKADEIIAQKNELRHDL